MPRIKLTLPGKFCFFTQIPVRITDLNYGAHVGNDTILSLIHEARVQFLRAAGYDELNVAGVGLIMSDVAIEFKSQLFYGTLLKAYVATADFTRIGFDMYYKLVVEKNGSELVIAVAKTGMACFDYTAQKIVTVPPEAVSKLSAA
jgi:acyl-CoA thioesterase FadM